jgi:hypothetical protein
MSATVKPMARATALVTTWTVAGLVAAGVAWTLGLHTDWWQRALMTLPVLGAAVLDGRGAELAVEIRVVLTGGLAALGWLQVPLAVAGGAWLAGLHAALYTRVVLAVVVAAVAVLLWYAPSAPVPTGGTR